MREGGKEGRSGFYKIDRKTDHHHFLISEIFIKGSKHYGMGEQLENLRLFSIHFATSPIRSSLVTRGFDLMGGETSYQLD